MNTIIPGPAPDLPPNALPGASGQAESQDGVTILHGYPPSQPESRAPWTEQDFRYHSISEPGVA